MSFFSEIREREMSLIFLEEGETDLRTQFLKAKQAGENHPDDSINLKKWAKSAIGLALSGSEDYSFFVEALNGAKTNLEKVSKLNGNDDINTLYYLGWVHVAMLVRDINIMFGDYDAIEELVTEGYKILKKVRKYVEEHPQDLQEVGLSDELNAARLLEVMEEIARSNDVDLPDTSSSSDKAKSNNVDLSDKSSSSDEMAQTMNTDKEDFAVIYLRNDFLKRKMAETDSLLRLCDAEDGPIKKIQILAEAITLLESVLAIKPDHESAKEKLESAKQKLVVTAVSLKGADERNYKRTRGDFDY